jgi:YbgC/YbaW family acyl-CoA thioester hydrolase
MQNGEEAEAFSSPHLILHSAFIILHSLMPSAFSILRRVQFAETDMAGIVHFSNYFRMMEEVEHAFFRSLGLSVAMQYEGMHVGWPRVSVSCDYFGPVRFEQEVELKLRVARLGEKSFNYEVDFLVEGRRMALGKTTSVCCELRPDGTMRSIPIPAAIREKLAPAGDVGAGPTASV